MRFRYAEYLTGSPVEKNTILFESFHGKEISDSPLAMARALLDMPEAKDLRIYFSTNDADRDTEVLKTLLPGAEAVHIHSEDYARLLATAGILVNNSSFPSYYMRREGQIYLQTWHGTPWKTLGKSMKNIETMHNSQHNFLQASHLLFPNDFTRETIMRDYVLEKLFTGKVITHGYPRNAVFCDKAEAERVKRLCGNEGISTLAYMPTWRGADNRNIQTDDYCAEMQELLAELDTALGDGQKLYVNLHPIVQRGVDVSGFRHIASFPQDIDKYSFINSMDALITDYSSIMFDYSITGKPVILFTYDYDNYVSERGVYFGIEELPFLRTDTAEELIELLRTEGYRSLDYSGSGEKAVSYRKRFLSYDTVTAASDMMQYILTEAGMRQVNGGDDSEGRAAAPVLRTEDLSRNREREWRLIDCPKLPSPLDIDTFAASVDPDRDLVVFHQQDFSERNSRRFRECYRDSFNYIFTTESVPTTVREAFSDRRAVRQAVDRRNRRRQAGELNIGSYEKYKPVRVRVDSFRTSGTRTFITASCPVSIGSIIDVVLEYRSDIENITHSLGYSCREEEGRFILDITADLSILKKGCIYWDLFVIVKDASLPEGEETVRYHAMLSISQRRQLKAGFYQCDLGDYIAFPHISLYETLAFTHREKTAYDDRGTRLKEIAAYSAYLLLGRLMRKRRIWIVFEKFCSAAQDNGYYFFRYCMEELPPEERKDIYFVIDRKAKDREKLEKYGRQVIPFMSFRHMLYCMAAKVFVGSDSRKHLYVWRPKPNLISGRIRRKPVHFLQHGVTALKRVDGLFGVNGSSPSTHITTTSDYEQRIMDEYFGYSPSNAPVVGFTRWDVLEDRSTPEDRMILVMPTWRSWLEEKTDEDFLASDYFRNYMTMLQDESLDRCLRENNVRLVFFIHPKFKDYLDKFTASSENIELVRFGSRPLNEIMMKCSMLITDYSSVCWDVYYMGKPVIFYQFDYDMYMENHGSYLDMETELFGDRFTELPDVIDSIRRHIAEGFAESERAKAMRPRYFKYIDSDNSKRTYEYLKKKGY